MEFPTLIRQSLDRPIVAVTIHGPHGLSLQIDALIDTGSDVTLFSSDVAHRLKIDLTGVPAVPVMTAVGPVATYHPCELTLRVDVGDSPTTGRRSPEVSRRLFAAPNVAGNLGNAGFL